MYFTIELRLYCYYHFHGRGIFTTRKPLEIRKFHSFKTESEVIKFVREELYDIY